MLQCTGHVHDSSQTFVKLGHVDSLLFCCCACPLDKPSCASLRDPELIRAVEQLESDPRHHVTTCCLRPRERDPGDDTNNKESEECGAMLGTCSLEVEIVGNKYMARVRSASGTELRRRHSEGTHSVHIDSFAWLHLAPEHVPIPQVDRDLPVCFGNVSCECKGLSASLGFLVHQTFQSAAIGDLS